MRTAGSSGSSSGATGAIVLPGPETKPDSATAPAFSTGSAPLPTAAITRPTEQAAATAPADQPVIRHADRDRTRSPDPYFPTREP